MLQLTYITDPSDGRRWPIPAGGAGDDDGGDNSQQGGDNDAQQGGDDDGDGDGSKTLTQAEVDRIVQERVARERAKYADYNDLKAKAQQAETDQERAVREAREQARNEALSEVGNARLEDRIQVAAAKQLNDPADAVRLIDRDGLDPYDDKVDTEISRRVKQLVEAKPYLAAPSAPPSGTGDAGSRGTVQTGGDMNDAIRRAAGRK